MSWSTSSATPRVPRPAARSSNSSRGFTIASEDIQHWATKVPKNLRKVTKNCSIPQSPSAYETWAPSHFESFGSADERGDAGEKTARFGRWFGVEKGAILRM